MDNSRNGGGGEQFRYVGKPVKRGDALEKVTGQWIYGTHFTLPGMLYAKALRSPYPHALIISIDISRGRELPCVRAVITGEDVPYRFGS